MNAQAVHDRLLAHYGPQHWWPADTPFEMMIGAILTQNTAWTNVEKAIAGLMDQGLLDAQAICTCDEDRLAEAIRPSGYFRQKAKRLKILAGFYLSHGGESGINALPEPRQTLLALHGVGPETADSILLYALQRPIFVVDAYTQRLFARLGLIAPGTPYHGVQTWFETHLPASVPLFQEYHALIVAHAKHHCRTRPLCTDCPLRNACPYPEQDEHGNMRAAHSAA